MNIQLRKLASIGSQSLTKSTPHINQMLINLAGERIEELYELLEYKNGFYAFESALHVFSSIKQNVDIDNVIDIATWNRDNLWRKEYGSLASKYLFFAEDIFGYQFCIRENHVYIFDPEIGDGEKISSTLNEWANYILQDYEALTGFPIAHEWQKQHGKIADGKRLLPKTPFVGGGNFDLENLYEGDAIEGMRARASLARQIHNLPDGTKIVLRVK